MDGHKWQLFKNRRTLWQMLRDVFAGYYRMSLLSYIICTAGIIYILFPFDLLPDYIPILGWTDDALVFYLMIRRLMAESQRYMRHKAAERRSGSDT